MTDTPAPIVVTLSDRDRALLVELGLIMAGVHNGAWRHGLPADATPEQEREAYRGWVARLTARLQTAGDPADPAAAGSSSAAG